MSLSPKYVVLKETWYNCHYRVWQQNQNWNISLWQNGWDNEGLSFIAATNKVWVSLHFLSRRYRASTTGGNQLEAQLLDRIIFLQENYSYGYIFWSNLAADIVFCDDFLSGGCLLDRDQTRSCACNVLRLRLEEGIWAILRQEVCRIRLVATFEATVWHRIPNTLAFFNTDVLPKMMRGVCALARAASWSGVTCFNVR